MIQNIVEALEDGDEKSIDTRVKPSLFTLLVDQAALIDSSLVNRDKPDLRTGFPDIRSLIEWYQRAAVRTVGKIEDDWPPIDCVDHPTLMAALIREPVAGIEPMPPKKAVPYRRMVESSVVQPACNKAYRRLRDAANEYITEEEERDDTGWVERELNPAKQRHIAMRPGYQTLDKQQAEALDEFWGGFETVDDLLDWLHGLNSPSNGAIPPDYAKSVITDDVAIRRFVTERDTDVAQRYREAIAATQIIPHFITGVTQMDASELAKTDKGGQGTLRQRSTHE